MGISGNSWEFMGIDGNYITGIDGNSWELMGINGDQNINMGWINGVTQFK